MSAKHIDLSNADYHAHPAIGSSMLEDFWRSRRLYHGRYVAKTILRNPPSDAMILGTLLHLRILEPQRYESELAPMQSAVAPDGKKWFRRQGSEHERWWAEYEATCEGKIIADAETRAKVEAMAAAVMANEDARLIIERRGEPEYSIFWTDSETKLDLKCRVDWMGPYPIDLKTTRDPSPKGYSRQFVELGYARKRAHYMAGIFAMTGEHLPFMHIAVRNEPPFEVGVYEIDDTGRDGVGLGESQWRGLLRELATCIEKNDWRNAWEKGVTTLSLPNYAFMENQYHLEEI